MGITVRHINKASGESDYLMVGFMHYTLYLQTTN